MEHGARSREQARSKVTKSRESGGHGAWSREQGRAER